MTKIKKTVPAKARSRENLPSHSGAGTTLREEKHFENHMLSLEIFADKTATKYDYSSDLREQTITRGIWNETDEIFESVPAKSTKIVRNFDSCGNEIRTENYVHTGTDFEFLQQNFQAGTQLDADSSNSVSHPILETQISQNFSTDFTEPALGNFAGTRERISRERIFISSRGFGRAYGDAS